MELISFKSLADAEVEETMRFEKSLQVHIHSQQCHMPIYNMLAFLLSSNFCSCMWWLQELRELRSELHKAAEYCETKFSQSEDKSEWVL